MPSMALHSFFGWDLDLAQPPILGPTKASYAAWQTSVITFSLLWLLLRPNAGPIAHLVLTVCHPGFAGGYVDHSDEVLMHEEVALCAAAV